MLDRGSLASIVKDYDNTLIMKLCNSSNSNALTRLNLVRYQNIEGGQTMSSTMKIMNTI